MRILIQASELNLSPEEVIKMLPKEKVESLKGKGVLQAYLLAHEGTSRPKVLGEGSQVLRWPRATIRTLTDRIKAGTKFFVSHKDGSNDHDGRQPVGEVLATFLKEIGGKLSNIIIGHFENEKEIEDLDVCSMEADIRTDTDIVSDINEVSGIALGNSDRDHPAFPGAMRLAMVQCFDTKPGEGRTKMGDQITFEQVKTVVRDLNIFPHQLFTLEDFKNDNLLKKIFEDNVTMKSENERLNKENKEIQDKNKEALRSVDVNRAQSKIKEILAEGHTDKQVKFILGRFKPETMEDLSDEGLNKFLENTKKEFAETAKLFGVADSQPTTSGASEKKDEDLSTAESMEEEALKILGVK